MRALPATHCKLQILCHPKLCGGPVSQMRQSLADAWSWSWTGKNRSLPSKQCRAMQSPRLLEVAELTAVEKNHVVHSPLCVSSCSCASRLFSAFDSWSHFVPLPFLSFTTFEEIDFIIDPTTVNLSTWTSFSDGRFVHCDSHFRDLRPTLRQSHECLCS